MKRAKRNISHRSMIIVCEFHLAIKKQFINR
jgi:hypothetical protein